MGKAQFGKDVAKKVLSKLTEEAKAISPVVKSSSQKGGALLKEGQLAEGQKIVQKLSTAIKETPEAIRARQAEYDFNLSPENEKTLKELKDYYEKNKELFADKKFVVEADGSITVINPEQKINSLKKAAAVAPMGMTGMSAQDILMNQPKETLSNLYTSIRKPVLEATRKVGEYISDKVRIPGVLTPEQIENERNIAGTIGEVAFDPTNLAAPGLGLGLAAADMALYNPEEPKETADEAKKRIQLEQLNNLRLK